MKYSNIYSQTITRLAFDVIAILLSYIFQYYLRFRSGLFPTLLPDFFAFAITGLVILAYWLLIFFFSGMYKNWHLISPFEEIFKVWKVVLIGTGLIVFFVLYDSSGSPRLLFLLYFVFLAVALTIGRLISRRIQVKLRENRVVTIPTILIGSASKVLDFYETSLNSINWGYRIDGIVLIDPAEKPLFDQIAKEKGLDPYFLGYTYDLDYIIQTNKPEEVILSTDTSNHIQLMDIVSHCSENGLRANIEPDLYSIFTGQTRTQSLYGIPLIEVRTELLKPWQETTKRVFDVLFSLTVLVIGSPLWLLIAILVKLDSPGPIIYTQPRIGKGGVVFKIYKFRSMKQAPPQPKETWTSVNDPRVTKFGRLIRKTHLDEIPQFWNVLIGDMSVVGPRPEQPKIVEDLIKQLPYYKRRHIVRPGITGWWQVKYRAHEFSIDEIKHRLKDDFYYIENLSLQLDFEIVVRTVWVVLKGHGQA